ncbi:MAG: c-type cytochrome biogenesis protein CcsB, partial [Acidithiobacillus sp.]
MSADIQQPYFSFNDRPALENSKFQRVAWAIFLTVGAFATWAIFRADFWMWQFIILGMWYVGLMWFGL